MEDQAAAEEAVVVSLEVVAHQEEQLQQLGPHPRDKLLHQDQHQCKLKPLLRVVV